MRETAGHAAQAGHAATGAYTLAEAQQAQAQAGEVTPTRLPWTPHHGKSDVSAPETSPRSLESWFKSMHLASTPHVGVSPAHITYV